MVYAKHIGRVGALAVALGVGLAVASTTGRRVREAVGFEFDVHVDGWVLGRLWRPVLSQI